jgi:hypothetical protein
MSQENRKLENMEVVSLNKPILNREMIMEFHSKREKLMTPSHLYSSTNEESSEATVLPKSLKHLAFEYRKPSLRAYKMSMKPHAHESVRQYLQQRNKNSRLLTQETGGNRMKSPLSSMS